MPAAELSQAAVAAVHVVDSPLLEPYTPDAYTDALQQAIAELKPDSRRPAAHVSHARLRAQAGGAPRSRAHHRLRRHQDAATGRRFSGPSIRASSSPRSRPRERIRTSSSVQIGAYRADSAKRGSAAAPVKPMTSSLDAAAIRQKAEEPFQEAKQAVDLSQAERIVAVGRGIKAQEHIALAEKLAWALGAQLAASRPICDSGWLPMERQVGSSGQTVAPKLYVALGISGAIQHVVGMKGARTIVAINKDAGRARSSKSPTTASSAICSRSCRR